MYPGGFTTQVTPDSSAEALESAQSFTPDPLRESTLGHLGLTKKKKEREKYRIGQVCTPATLGQKQQPRSGAIPTQGQLVARGSLG